MALRNADELLLPHVEAVVAELRQSQRIRAEDAGTVQLAREYARTIDGGGEGDELEKLGPKLLSALEALGASPRARARLTKGGERGAQPQGPLARLREA